MLKLPGQTLRASPKEIAVPSWSRAVIPLIVVGLVTVAVWQFAERTQPWDSRPSDPGMEFMNLCYQDRFDAARAYLEEHPELATSPLAINASPSLVAVAFLDDEPRVVELLLEFGAPLDATDALRRTPLAIAIEAKNLRVARLLLERGAKLGERHPDVDLKELAAAIEKDLEHQTQTSLEILRRSRLSPAAARAIRVRKQPFNPRNEAPRRGSESSTSRRRESATARWPLAGS